MEAVVANENIAKNLEEQIVANMKEEVVPQLELEGEVLPKLTEEKGLPNLSEEEIQPNFEDGFELEPNLQKEVLPKLKENIMPELNEEAATDTTPTGEDEIMMGGGEPDKNEFVFPLSSHLLENVHKQHLPLKPVEMNFPYVAEEASGKKDDMEKVTESLEVEAPHVLLEPTKSKSKNDDDDHGLNQEGNLKSNSSDIVVGEQQQKKYNEPYCCPKQVLRLLADYEYYFREEEWKLRGNLQADNPERTHLVMIIAEKDEKKRLTGMGMAGNFRLAENSAALDLCEQLQMEHHLVLPKSQIYPDLRLSPSVLKALDTECDMRELSAPRFKQSKGRSAYGGLRNCSIVVDEIKKQGKGVTDHIARQDAAYKMYEAITGEAFPLVEIIKGQHCSDDFENRYDQTSNRELPMLKLKIPKRGLIPSGFSASLKEAAPLMSADDDISNSNDVETQFAIPSDSDGLLLTEHSDDFKNEEIKAFELGVEKVSPLSQTPASTSTADVDQKNQKDVAESASAITSDIAAIREVMDDFHPKKANEPASHNFIPRAMTSLAILGVLAALVAYAIKK